MDESNDINLVADIDELKAQMRQIYVLLAEHLVKQHGTSIEHFND